MIIENRVEGDLKLPSGLLGEALLLFHLGFKDLCFGGGIFRRPCRWPRPGSFAIRTFGLGLRFGLGRGRPRFGASSPAGRRIGRRAGFAPLGRRGRHPRIIGAGGSSCRLGPRLVARSGRAVGRCEGSPRGLALVLCWSLRLGRAGSARGKVTLLSPARPVALVAEGGPRRLAVRVNPEGLLKALKRFIAEPSLA